MKQPNIVVIGSLNMDIAVESPRVPQLGETITGTSARFIPGGKGANQAVAASRLGAHVEMIGFVGDDPFGDSLLESLAADGVSIKGVKKAPEESTGIATIVIAENDNQIIVVPGANAHCLPQSIGKLEETIAAADIVLMQLEIPLETVCIAAELAEKHRKCIILNPAPAVELPPELLRRLDYITPNRSELQLLTGVSASDDSLTEAIDVLIGQGPRCVVTTLGSEGVVYKRKGEEPVRLPAHVVPVVDTTGAGDAFNAALAYGIASGFELQEAVRLATQVSALAVTRFGAQTGMPTMDEVRQRFQVSI